MSEHVVPADLANKKTVHTPPVVRLDSTDFPEIKDYDVGDTYSAIYKCKMVSKHQGGESIYGENEDPNLVRGTFQVLSVKPLDHSTSNEVYAKLKAINKRLN